MSTVSFRAAIMPRFFPFAVFSTHRPEKFGIGCADTTVTKTSDRDTTAVRIVIAIPSLSLRSNEEVRETGEQSVATRQDGNGRRPHRDEHRARDGGASWVHDDVKRPVDPEDRPGKHREGQQELRGPALQPR